MTVSIPGRAGTPAEVLSGGAPPDRPPTPRGVRAAAAGVAVLVVGALAFGQDPEPPSAAPVPSPVRSPVPIAAPDAGARGVAASVGIRRVGPDAPYVERLTVTVALRGADLEGDRPGSPQGRPVTLVGVEARGFFVTLPGRTLPVALGELDPTSTEVLVVELAADVVVSDCAFDAMAQRRVVLSVVRGDRPPQLVPADVSRPVVRVLDRLVSRTCRRPRG